MIWNPIFECDDEDGNPTVWASEVNSDSYGKFIWIEKYDEKEYHITACNPEWYTLKICKSLASAKRWVSSNIKLND